MAQVRVRRGREGREREREKGEREGRERREREKESGSQHYTQLKAKRKEQGEAKLTMYYSQHHKHHTLPITNVPI